MVEIPVQYHRKKSYFRARSKTQSLDSGSTKHHTNLDRSIRCIVDRDRFHVSLVSWSYQIVQTPVSDVLQGSFKTDQSESMSVVWTVLGESEMLHVAQVR